MKVQCVFEKLLVHRFGVTVDQVPEASEPKTYLSISRIRANYLNGCNSSDEQDDAYEIEVWHMVPGTSSGPHYRTLFPTA